MVLAGIYRIISPTNRVYIGQSWNIPKRFAKYRSGHNHHQRKLHASFLKYGPSAHSFEVLFSFLPLTIQSEMDWFEQIFMNQHRALGYDLLNLKDAGSRGRMSEESKRLIGLAGKGRKVSEQAKLKISAANRGRRRSEDVRRRISAIQKGKKRGPHSPEQNQKQRERMLGTHPSNETRQKQSAWQTGRKRPHISVSNKRRAAAGTMYFQNRLAPSGIDHPRYGQKHSPESLEKMSASHRGHQRATVESRAVISQKVRGEGNAAAILTENQVREIRAKYKPYKYQQSTLAQEYGVSRATISGIVDGRLWRHLLDVHA